MTMSSSGFSPTSAELTLVSQILSKADPQKLGILTSDVAVRILGGTKLPPVTLGEIWNVADEENNGWLPRKGLAIAVRLIGWAQKGEKVSQALVSKPGPLAIIEGINAVGQQNTGMSAPSSPPPPSVYPPLTPEDKRKFQNMFLTAGAVNGMLNGDKARDLFLKSKLSNEQLMKIWNLADTQDRGVLDAVDFTIGMYFIQGVMSGTISLIPTVLPPSLYQQAGGFAPTPSVKSHTTGTSGSFSPVRSNFRPGQIPLQPQTTGFPAPMFAPSLPARPGTTQTNGLSAEWDVTPSEKASSDHQFGLLDAQKRGYIDGDIAVPFMLRSQLPGEVLAHVWDLADIHKDGHLSRDGFAIAMHLIQKKLIGQEIPSTLPLSLIPPELRSSFFTQSPFSLGQTQPEPVVDLVSFDDPLPSAVQSPSAQHPSILKPQTPNSLAPIVSSPKQLPIDHDPFSVAPSRRDFLSDDDIHSATPPFHDQSAGIGNVRIQLQSTEKSLSATQQEHQTLEKTLADQASQLSTLQTQLSSAKAAYETEMTLLSTLKERRSVQIAEIQKTREELIRAESDLSAVRVEKSEIEGAFLRDKEEARDLHKRMIEATQQAETLKSEVEKLKKEAKQQKGLLAIARKQLSTKEAEKSKVEKEHQDASAEVMTLNEEKIAVEAEVAKAQGSSVSIAAKGLTSSDSLVTAAAQPLLPTPDFSQPVKINSNNPFEKLALSSIPSTPRPQSPFQTLQTTVLSSPLASTNGIIPPAPEVIADTTLEATEEGKPSDRSPHLLSASFSKVGLPLLHTDTPSVYDEASPSIDTFVTPPSTANPPTVSESTTSLTTPKFPPLEDIASAATSSSKMSSPQMASQKSPTRVEMDLTHQLVEIDADESDSDSDEESDEERPLGDAKPRANGSVSVEEDPGSFVTVPAAQLTSFEDIFGPSEPEDHNQVKEGTTPFDSLIVTAAEQSNTSEPKPTEDTPHVAGVAEFDATFHNIPTSTSNPAVDFFDDAFEPSFDFSSAKAEVSTSPREATTQVQPNAFNDVFGTTGSTAPVNNDASQPISTSNESRLNSFDTVFSGPDSGIATQEDQPDSQIEPRSSPVVPPVPAVPADPAQPLEDSMPGAFPSQPGSPAASRTSAEREKPSKSRISSSSSKETHEKPKDHSRSKLSLRLPFRKKKAQQEPIPPPPSRLLAPPIEEEPDRARTPANDDDVEAVKQLTAMGFSRGQAIEALEKFNYNVPRALNNLLGKR